MFAVLAGDFNCVIAARDCTNRLGSDVSRVESCKRLRDFDLVDANDYVTTVDTGYTHWHGGCHARFDRVDLSGDFLDRCLRRKFGLLY